MALAGLALNGWTQSAATDSSDWTVVPFSLAAVALVLAGLWFYNRGRKLQSLSAEDLMARDPRAPVLYLRSFKDDKKTRATPLAGTIGIVSVCLGIRTEEEQLAEAMNEIGPFIAIGKPGEKLPELGAARMYVSDAEWQSVISDLMSRARMLVLRAADTDGFWWEVKHAVEHMAPEQLIFLLPFKKREYTPFRERAERLLPCRLPEYEGAANLVGSRLRAVLYFDRDWTPHIQKLRVPFSLSLTPLVIALKKALRPVIAALSPEARQVAPRRRREFAFLRTIPAVLLVVLGVPVLSAVANGLYRGASSVSHNDQGLRLLHERRLDEAILEFEQALRITPDLAHRDLAHIHSNLGLAWYYKRDLDRAMAEYVRALRLDPNIALLRNNVGLALLEKGDRERAVEEFQLAIRLDPTIAVAHANLCHALSGQINLDETVAACRDALRLNPSSANPHFVLGNVARVHGDYAAAIDRYRDAVRLDPGNALVHNNLGWTLTKIGNIQDGMAAYREAIRLNPHSPEAHWNLGEALAALGDRAGATIEFRTTVNLLPNSGLAHYNLGLAMDRQGDYVGSRRAFIKAFELAPEDPNIRNTYQQIVRR
jgi:tetratricopeptide (TPR) repeat protein